MPNTSHAAAPELQPVLARGRIGRLELRNRFIGAPMGTNFADADGVCGPRIQAYYEERAKGGAGLLTMGACAIAYPAGTAEPHQVGLSRDDHIEGLREVARRVHAHGALLSVQLQHAGKTSTQDYASGREVWVPSMPPPLKTDMLEAFTPQELSTFVGALGRQQPRIRVMSAEDVATMVGWFADAAARAQAAGVDAVELHAAHTYLLAGFLSPYYNRRTDDYGGPLANRARLLLEVLKAVKQRCGADFPVVVRLDAQELRTPGGITLEDALETARLCEAAGADAISVSAYATITTGTAFTEAPLVHQPRALVPQAQQFKQTLGIPVIAVGRIEPEEAAQDIAQGRYDFVGMARKLLADPELPIKVSQGRLSDVRPCIYCYACVSQIFVNQRVKCAVNPLTGHEHESPDKAAPVARHVVVVGGGPAGLEAARTAALRGHRVTLLERSDRLGGTLFFAALAYAENGKLLDWLVRQVQSLPIDVRLGAAATMSMLRELAPDHVIVATGAQREAPDIPGATQDHVWSGDELRRLMTGDGAQEIANRKLNLIERGLFKAGGLLKVTDSRSALQGLSKLWMPIRQQVVILGGGLVGLELAEFLIERGRQVTVLEPSAKPGPELAIVRRWRVLDVVKHHGTLHAGVQIQSIGARSVQWVDAQGQAQETAAESVILALGARPDAMPAQQLADAAWQLQCIGDAHELGYIEGALREGHAAALAI